MSADDTVSLDDFVPNDSAINWYNAYDDNLNDSYATMHLQEELLQDHLLKNVFTPTLSHTTIIYLGIKLFWMLTVAKNNKKLLSRLLKARDNANLHITF